MMFRSLLTVTMITLSTAAFAGGPAKSVPLDDWVLSGHRELMPYSPPISRLEVVGVGDKKYSVVGTYWDTDMQKMMPGSVITLDANNQFQVIGTRWQFTLTSDGYLTWEQVPRP